MAVTLCRPCIGLPCTNPDDLAAGVDTAIYSNGDFSFIVQCPNGCFCPPGLFPQTISILASTIPPVIPPILEPGGPIILRLQGCMALITRTLDANSTQAQIVAAAQGMFAEWSGQQALCDALLVPGVSCATMIDICNDQIVFPCFTGNVVIPAGTFCEKLATDGLTQAQIDAQTAAIKAVLNNQAINKSCPGGGIICTIVFTPTVNLGFSGVGMRVINMSNKTVDLSPFQLCLFGGVPSPTCFPPSLPVNLSVGPNTFVDFAGAVSPLPLTATVTYAGALVTSIPNPIPINSGFRIDITVGCNG